VARRGRPSQESIAAAPVTVPDRPSANTAIYGSARAEPLALEEVTIREGDVFEGNWRIGKQLGAGGMGTVYAAHDIALDRTVAIKVLNDELCRDQEFVVRFEREARSTARLEHPNVVPIHAVGRHQGRPFMVMKKLEGETLAWHLDAEGRLSTKRTLEIMRQLCAGLGHLHANGCVHRDIKAGNIFIGPTGVATILDLGVLRDPRSPGNTQVGTIVGTPRYMSPEQARGVLEVDHRADLYALGILLFECLAGCPPFESTSNVTVIRMHAESAPPDITAANRDLPASLVPVINRALAKRPEERFGSAGEFLAALEDALAEPKVDPQNFDPSTIPGADAPFAGADRSSQSPAWLRPLLLAALLACTVGFGYPHRDTALAWIQSLRAALAPREQPAPIAEPGRVEKPVPAPVDPAPDKHPTEPKKPVDVRRPKEMMGLLKITTWQGTRPYPATVFVDGDNKGLSPVKIELTAAQHHVRVERANWQTVEEDVVVPNGGSKDLRIQMVP
jgi:serine/threonine-protein kinase